MRVRFIANACNIYESKGKRLLTDPWLIDGVFDGAWFHFPPLRTTPDDVKDCDYLYISHIHPDHCQKETLDHFRRDIPIIVLDHSHNYLIRCLEGMGFTNLFKLKDRQTCQFGPFKVTMFAPFCAHPFFHSDFGNPIDSAIVVQDKDFTIANFNDNTPDIKSAERISEQFQNITLAQINYNNAGPYPACFHNLLPQEKQTEHARLIDRNMAHLMEIVQALKCGHVMPFAGAYVIGGSSWPKNRFLGTIDGHEAAKRCNGIYLSEGQSFNLENGRISGYRDIPSPERKKFYIENVLSKRKYSYESDKEPVIESSLVQMALERMALKMKTLNIYPRCRIKIIWGEDKKEAIEFEMGKDPITTLECKLDKRLFKRILSRESHWNNAEIGCHIDFRRTPNIYQPDVHLLLSFLHL